MCIKIQVSSQETFDPCFAQYWGKLPDPNSLSFHGTQAPDTRLLSLILLWHCLGRGGLLLNSSFPTPPLLNKSFTWSVLNNVMFHCTFWFGDHGSCQYLVLPQNCVIAQAWYLVLRDTTKHAYHSKNPWPHIVWSLPNACLSLKACCCIFYLLLLRSTCHNPSFMPHYPSHSVSPPWHIQAIDLLCFALTGSHWQMCPWHRCILSIGPISWMWMHYAFGSQGMIWWWMLCSASSNLQNSPQEMSFIFWHRLSTCCLPPSFMASTLEQLYH